LIGAEILALVALILGGSYGAVISFRWIAVRGASRALKRGHDYAEEEQMHREMREALEKPGTEPIDAFLALWDAKLSKDQKKRLESIRDDRVINS